jgi:excinuclease UvrABC nuclease subunit
MQDHWQPPYLNNHCSKSKFRNRTGVYIVRLKHSNEIIYVGMGSCVYKALYRHFQKWNDQQQRRSLFKKEETEVRIITTPKELVHRTEVRLIRLFKPKENTILYEQSMVDDEPFIFTTGLMVDVREKIICEF